MRVYHRWNGLGMLMEGFSYDLEMETREKTQKEQTNGNRAIWLVYRTGPNAQVKNLIHAREHSKNKLILRFDVTVQHDWPIEQCLLHIRVFFSGKTKRSCFDLFVHWLIKQIKNTYRNHFSRSYENCSNMNLYWITFSLILFKIYLFDVFNLVQLKL